MNFGDLGPNGERLAQRIRNLPFPELTLVDVGVRDGCSSVIMWEASLGKPSRVIGIDASECPYVLLRNPSYSFICADSVTALSELKVPVHCCWIDTLHIAHQVAAELFFLWPLMPVGSVIGLHDTAWPKGKRDHYCDRDWPTPDVAVDWLFTGKSYAAIETYPESWGATFVTKTKDAPLELTGITWAEVFAGRNELLAVLPESVRKREITV